jgi:hypothetical protein
MVAHAIFISVDSYDCKHTHAALLTSGYANEALMFFELPCGSFKGGKTQEYIHPVMI